MKKNNDITELAARYAAEAEVKYGGCAQATLLGLMKTIGNIPDGVFQAASGLGGGVARQGETCGAVTGAIMALSMYCGRSLEKFDDSETKYKNFDLCEKFCSLFRKEYGCINCYGIQTKIMGKSYKLYNPVEKAAFKADGGHNVEKCPSVCGTAVKIVINLLKSEGLLDI